MGEQEIDISKGCRYKRAYVWTKKEECRETGDVKKYLIVFERTEWTTTHE